MPAARPRSAPALALASAPALVTALLLVTGCSGSGSASAAAPASTASSPTASASASPTASGSPAPSPVDTGSGPVEGRTAEQILASTQAAAAAASTVVVRGTASGSTVVARLGASDADTTISAKGTTVEVLKIGSDNYIRGDAAFWTAQVNADAGKLFAGKYVKIPAEQASSYQAFLGVAAFFDNTLKPEGAVSKAGVATVAGQRVVMLKDGSDGSLLYVSTAADPLPVRISKQGTDGGVVTFSGWNKPLTVKAPPAADVVDFTAVTGG